MKKIAFAFFCLVFAGVLLSPLAVKGTDGQSAQELIQKLQQQIEQLNSQITILRTQLSAVNQTKSEIKGTLQLIKQLKSGMSGDDVKLLQEILATDKDIYPEGLITGYYGKLTEKAVKKFQNLANLEQVGNVGPKTMAKINKLLKKGAGNSGKVPPGLLIAPGIRKKLGDAVLSPLPGQILPPGIQKKLDETTTPSNNIVN
jgi:peptidoglycan hydrolase-like protein with peptidoglycan-binding domain